MIRAVASLFAVLVVWWLVPPSPVLAADMTVGTADDELTTNDRCSLREAILNANADAAPYPDCPAGTGPDTIHLPARTYQLTQSGRLEDGGLTGDLDLTGTLTIAGEGAGSTIVEAGPEGASRVDRVFDVQPGATVEISGITIRRGDPGPAADPFDFSNQSGGGIRSRGALTLDLVVVTANQALSGSFFSSGGGVSNQIGGSLTIRRSAVSGNLAAGDGGGINSSSFGPVTLDAVTISGNLARLGGGVDVDGGSIAILNSTISDNRATGQGGGIINQGATMAIDYSTIVLNRAPIRGGLDHNTSQPVAIRATIIALNAGGDCSFFRPTSAVSLGSNLDGDGGCPFTVASDLRNRNPRIGPLSENGGPTPTHALLSDSPAIDAVQEACPPAAADQRGVTRPRDGNADGLARCDIGAFEVGLPGILQFSAPTYTVGESGPSAAITVTRTGGDVGTVGAMLSPTDGTATVSADYVNTPILVTLSDRETTRIVQVPIIDDAADEPDETVNLALGGPTGGATLGAQQTALLTIADNDPPPTLSIADVSLAEGNSGTTSFTFTVTLTGATNQTVSVGAQTADGTATAASGDYTSTGPQTLTFAPGMLTQTFTVPVAGDLVTEPGETFFVNLSGETNATVADRQGQGTVLDDDGPPTLSIGNASATEGDAGTTVLTFTATLSRPSSQPVTVQYATQDGAAPAGATGGATCTPGVDYVAATGQLTFQPLDTSETIAATVCPDLAQEGNETVLVNLSGASGAPIGSGQGAGTILDDDVAPPLAFSAATVQVPENAGSVTLTVQRSVPGTAANGIGQAGAESVPGGSVRPGPSPGPTNGATVGPAGLVPVSVSYGTGPAGGPANASGQATPGQDFQPVSGTLTFGLNETTKTISVPILADGLQEGPEAFTVGLSSPSAGATPAQPATVTVIIVDTSHGAAGSPGDDSAADEREARERETEDQRRQRERTNRAGKDDESVEGDVLETRCDQPWPAVVIANRDGQVEVRLVREAQAACRSITVGDYLEADGEKIHEGLFDADSISVSR